MIKSLILIVLMTSLLSSCAAFERANEDARARDCLNACYGLSKEYVDRNGCGCRIPLGMYNQHE